MADYSDVQTALVSLIEAVIYPNGTGLASATGLATITYAGWPNAQQLNNDMSALNANTGGRVHITVFATNIERDTTRYWPQTPITQLPTNTMTLAVSGISVTVGGTAKTLQNLLVIIGGQAYSYQTNGTDTLATSATALAALIPGATSAGAVITLPAASKIGAARVGGLGTMLQIYGSMERVFQVTIWANNPANRTATATAIDQALRQQSRFTLADGTTAYMKYRNSPQDDIAQRDNLYRRDINYAVEFDLSISSQAAQVQSIGIGESVRDYRGNTAVTVPTTFA